MDAADLGAQPGQAGDGKEALPQKRRTDGPSPNAVKFIKVRTRWRKCGC